jgi:hypothetical protein
MMLSTQFPELFREETYAINLALYDNKELENPFNNILAKEPITALWCKEYSVVPIGALGGREEGEPIPQKNMVMGYTCYGAQGIEASGKVSLSKQLQQRSKEFMSASGEVDEAKFAGHLADSVSRGFLTRRAQKWHRLSANIFNYGGIAAGHSFFNQRTRAGGLSDVPDSDLGYDGVAMFALPSAPHPAYADSATSGAGSAPVGSTVDMAGAIADTGGYFNAFQLPPSNWALQRVWTHYVNNMQFDENNELYYDTPNTLLVSSHNLMKWIEILESKFIEPKAAGDTTNIENIFQMEGFSVRLVHSPFLIKNTWFLGKSGSGGVKTLVPSIEEDPWAYYRDEDNRSYFISFEDQWGFIYRNWRRWCAGSISTDGSTIPTFNDVAQEDWNIIPSGV